MKTQGLSWWIKNGWESDSLETKLMVYSLTNPQTGLGLVEYTRLE